MGSGHTYVRFRHREPKASTSTCEALESLLSRLWLSPLAAEYEVQTFCIAMVKPSLFGVSRIFSLAVRWNASEASLYFGINIGDKIIAVLATS
jgi:hypothetical protein